MQVAVQRSFGVKSGPPYMGGHTHSGPGSGAVWPLLRLPRPLHCGPGPAAQLLTDMMNPVALQPQLHDQPPQHRRRGLPRMVKARSSQQSGEAIVAAKVTRVAGGHLVAADSAGKFAGCQTALDGRLVSCCCLL